MRGTYTKDKLTNFAFIQSCADKAKALFRRATAHAGLKDEEAALADLEVAIKLVPGDAVIAKELAQIKKAAADRLKKEKALYSKAFA